MNKHYRFPRLGSKTAAVVAASLALLQSREAVSMPLQMQDNNNFIQNLLNRKRLKPKLTLKLNPYRPENSLLAYHSSHSSHSSHASHSSHSSGGYASGSSSGDGGSGLGVLVVGGAIAYGAYRLGKRNSK